MSYKFPYTYLFNTNIFYPINGNANHNMFNVIGKREHHYYSYIKVLNHNVKPKRCFDIYSRQTKTVPVETTKRII